jgi:hypothetical protein
MTRTKVLKKAKIALTKKTLSSQRWQRKIAMTRANSLTAKMMRRKVMRMTMIQRSSPTKRMKKHQTGTKWKRMLMRRTGKRLSGDSKIMRTKEVDLLRENPVVANKVDPVVVVPEMEEDEIYYYSKLF